MAKKSSAKPRPEAKPHALEETFAQFLRHPEKKVLILKGKWGVGKTYAWKRCFEKEIEMDEVAISYVSLFGVKDLKEVQQLIVQKAVPKKLQQLRSISKIGIPILHALKGVPLPYLKDAVDATENVAALLVRKFLVCFDDIERKSKDLPLSAILGLVSVLKEENGCRVVLIFNEDQIDDADDKASLNKYREKVVDQEVAYDPPVGENVRLIFQPNEYPVVQEVFQRLGINNIRIIKFTHWNAEFFEPYLASLESAVRDSFLVNLAILTCLFHKHGNEVDLSNLPDRSFVAIMLREKEKEPTAAELLLKQAQYLNRDHDPFIVEYLQAGRCRSSELGDVLVSLNARELKNQTDYEFRRTWRLFNGNFKASSEEVIEGFKTFVRDHLRDLVYGELKQVCDLFDVLGEKELSQQWINNFVESNIATMNLETAEHFKGLTTSAEAHKRISERAEALRQQVSLKSVIYRIVEQSGWNPKDESFLNSCTEEDYYKWIETETDEDLLDRLRGFHRIFNSRNTSESGRAIGTKLEAVLCKFASRSKLDAYRVRVFFGLPKTNEQQASESS